MAGGSQQNIVSELTECLGNVTFDPSLWAGFTQQLSKYTDDSKVILQVIESKPFTCMNLQSYGFMDDTIRNYIDHYIDVSPWRGAILQAAEAAPIWADQHVSMKEYFRSEFYNDLMRRERRADSATGMNIIKEKDRMVILGVHFDSKKSDSLHWKVSHILSTLHQDIKKAMNINRLLHVEAPRSVQAGGFSLANIKLPAFIVDNSAYVISVNDAIEELISKYNLFSIGALNKLCFLNVEAQSDFHAKISGLSKSILLGAEADYTDLRINYSDLIFKFSFFPMSHTHNIADFSGVAAHNSSINTFMVIVSVQKSKDIDVALSDLLIKSYGLTKSEVKLISYLADGNTLQKIASITNTSIHTVRTHLKSIFQKTNIRRQQELVALVHVLRQQVGT